MFVGLICIYLAYTFNSSNLYSISGKAYGTTWSVTSTEFIADHHEKKILDIIDTIDAIASNYKSDSEIALIKPTLVKYPELDTNVDSNPSNLVIRFSRLS